MNTGIIILNYNDSETTEKFINQIKKYNELNYIIIVDNCSTDNSYKKLKKYESEKIKVIKTNENKGYASGNNYGIKYLVNNFDIDYIIISNPDIIVEEKVIKKLKEDLYKNKNISIISPLIKQNNEILRGWKLPSYKDELLSNINYIHRIARKKLLYNDEHYKNVLSKVDVVSGCFFVSRKEDFEKINYFDEGTFLYYEENIIGKKFKDINNETYVDSSVSIVHNESISVDKSIGSLKKYKILKESQRYYQKKYNNVGIIKLFFLKVTYYISYFISYIIIKLSKKTR